MVVERPQITNESALAYNTRLDVATYQNLLGQKRHLDPEQFAQELSRLNRLVSHNIETALGERYNAELFQENYFVRDEQIWSHTFNTPFLDVVKRGQQFRQQKGSREVGRELAEVEGFEKVQQLLTTDYRLPTTVIVISPKGPGGSIYQHNFYDVYQKNQAGEITMTRLTRKFTYEQFYETAKIIDHENSLPQNPKDADFLKNPLKTSHTLDQIKNIFQPQENTMPLPEYKKLLEVCTPLNKYYVNCLIENPNEYEAEKNFRSIVQFAEIYTGNDIGNFDNATRLTIINSAQKTHELPYLIPQLSAPPIRQMATSCGIFGSPSYTTDSLFRPFSVADFGNRSLNNKSEDKSDFQCPGRKKDGSPCTYIVRYGSGTRKCPECGEEAKCG